MNKEFFTEDELDALKGGTNESPVKSETEVDDEGNGGYQCCNGDQQMSLENR